MRWRSILVALATVATVVSTNMNLLPVTISTEWKGIITLFCLILLALNHSVVGSANPSENVGK